ncbi:hypothetical protein SAMN05421740_10455 [Parapedobacter koreensis]|uniref:Glycosyl transferases group 1 n=2 Tax=Parapedobacter koreensis TaxID=332977 RepID=A0A1H7NQC4_9SPHI|nr:hypothetical protein SAMN05421740_10455 [Parapedobacter koreensis]
MMERSQPLRHIDDKQFVVYFAGLLHIDYYPNFKALAKALNMIAEEGVSIKLILRGTQKLNFLNDVKFRVVYNSDFVSDEEIKKEIDAATILYLPMKFTVPEFYLYSMSTKMISYLTAKGSIFYHGPENSAAANLLHKWDAATICESLNVTEVKDDLLLCLRDINQHSSNAKELARDQFNMNEILDKFWN